MSLTLALLLIASAGFVAALWVQGTGIEEDPAVFQRRRRRVSLGLGMLLAALGAVLAVHESRLVQRLLAPPEDGAWGAVSLDRQSAPAQEYRLSITGGRVAGGRDGCNDWSFEAPDEKTGERRIFMTLVECDDADSLRRAYRALAFADRPALELRPDGSLRIAASGHVGLFRRCRWGEPPRPPGASGSGPPICAVDRGGTRAGRRR